MAKKKNAAEPEVKTRTLGYFAVDGSYGNAVGMTIMETTHWNETDWDIIENADDSARPELARAITESYEKDADEGALRATFEKLGVDLAQYESKK